LTVINSRKINGLKNFSLEVRSGEIVGLAGVEGNGQKELIEAITGLRKVESGKIFLKNKDITNISVRERIESGISSIPEDRHKHGLVLDFTVEDNLVLKSFHQKPYSNKGLLNREAIHEHAEKVIEDFDVRTGQGPATSARSLSGGNQQKAIVGREIAQNPEVLIAVQPTRGLDVGAIEYIHKRIVEQRDHGKAVLLISLELDEILDLSDRIAVINNGELIDIVDAAITNENEVGLMMAGVKRGDSK
jgi:simple sugar transport system ATP-binding protein